MFSSSGRILSHLTLKRRLRTISRLARKTSSLARKPSNSLRLLPQNESLEKSIALAVYHQQDARSMLTFTKELMGSSLISLASPVGAWDPYDVKPQVFALDTYLGIPVFSSVSYLNEFCQKFQFCVRDPTGRVWSDGTKELQKQPPLFPTAPVNEPTQPHASQLFELLEESGSAATKKRKRKSSMKQKQNSTLPKDLWDRVATEPRLGIMKATPLPMFGPLIRPYFIGYFADVETLLRNASIAPEKADIVLNPSSPLEIVLGRGATDRVLHRDSLILSAFQQLEKQIRSEFNNFFRTHCGEVSAAFSACIAKAHSSELFHNYIDYTIVVVVKSDDMFTTFQSLVHARSSRVLLDHPNLEVLPDTDAAAHAKAASTSFYERILVTEGASSVNSKLGVMRRATQVAQVSLGVGSDNYFSDPTNLYTESGFVFTGEAKSQR